MPTMDGKLTEKEVGEIARVLNDRIADPNDACQVCGKTPSYIIPYLSKLELGLENGLTRHLSTTVTVCSKCGYVRHFTMRELGLPGHPGTIEIDHEYPEEGQNG